MSSRFVEKNKGAIALAFIAVISLIWMTRQVGREGTPTLPERVVMALSYPFVKAADGVKSTARNVWGGYIYVFGLTGENDKLRQANSRLVFENTKLRESLKRRERFEDLWALKEETDYPVIPARVIGRDASAWFRSVLVDMGEKDGVVKDMPAAQYCGLVGRVSRVYHGVSRVMLITDPASAVSCELERSRATGILAGDGSGVGELTLRYVDRGADVKPGDLVITSGLDGIFPQGLPVGEVVKTNKDAPGFFLEVKVKPTADLARAEELLLFKYTPPAKQP